MQKEEKSLLILDWTDISLDPFQKKEFEEQTLQVGLFNEGVLSGMKMILIDYKTLTLFFQVYPANVHESKIYPLILEMLKKRSLIRFGDAIIMDRGFYSYKNYLIGIRYGVVPIIPREKFRFERLKGLLAPLFIFNSKNVEKEKKYRKLAKNI